MLRPLFFTLSLALVGGFAAPEAAAAPAARCKAEKKKPKKPRAVRAPKAKVRAKKEKPAPAPKPVTAQTIKLWEKKGLADAEIVEKAEERGYVVGAAEKKRLEKLKVRRSLIAALGGAPAAAPVAVAAKQPIDLQKVIHPSEIDFDSVPPPSGMPRALAEKQEREKDEKKLDTSLRPSAPFEGTRKPASASDGSGRRVVFSAGAQ